jgi:hypothetical protein
MTEFADALTTAETAIGGGVLFSKACRRLIQGSPADPHEAVVVSVIALQNILRGAFREIDGD